MTKFFLTYLVTVFLLMRFALIVFAASPVNSGEVAVCMPFAAKEVPEESGLEWKLRPEHSTDNDISSGRFYRTDSGLRLGVYSYFGQVAFKTWSCRGIGEENAGKDMPDHTIAVLKDGKWYSVYAQAPYIFVDKDKNGRVRVTITLIDPKTGNRIVRRTITQ